MIEEWKRRIITALGGVVPDEKQSFVMDADMERAEELRVDRLGIDENDLMGDREPFIPDDPWRPATTLGPIRRR